MPLNEDLLAKCEAYLVEMGFVKEDKPNCVLFYYTVPEDRDKILFSIYRSSPLTLNAHIIPWQEGRRLSPIFQHIRIDAIDDLIWICDHQEDLHHLSTAKNTNSSRCSAIFVSHKTTIMSLKTLFSKIGHSIAALFTHAPEAEAVISQVINGISNIYTFTNSSQADVIAAVFPNGIGAKTLEEVKLLLPEISEVSHIAQNALAASDGLTDPSEKANAVITTTLNEVAKLPELAKEAHLLTILSGIVSKVLGISYTEASHLVSAKQIQLAVPAEA